MSDLKIIIAGASGSGKSTAIEIAAKALREAGFVVVTPPEHREIPPDVLRIRISLLRESTTIRFEEQTIPAQPRIRDR